MYDEDWNFVVQTFFVLNLGFEGRQPVGYLMIYYSAMEDDESIIWQPQMTSNQFADSLGHGQDSSERFLTCTDREAGFFQIRTEKHYGSYN